MMRHRGPLATSDHEEAALERRVLAEPPAYLPVVTNVPTMPPYPSVARCFRTVRRHQGMTRRNVAPCHSPDSTPVPITERQEIV